MKVAHRHALSNSAQEDLLKFRDFVAREVSAGVYERSTLQAFHKYASQQSLPVVLVCLCSVADCSEVIVQPNEERLPAHPLCEACLKQYNLQGRLAIDTSLYCKGEAMTFSYVKLTDQLRLDLALDPDFLPTFERRQERDPKAPMTDIRHGERVTQLAGRGLDPAPPTSTACSAVMGSPQMRTPRSRRTNCNLTSQSTFR